MHWKPTSRAILALKPSYTPGATMMSLVLSISRSLVAAETGALRPLVPFVAMMSFLMFVFEFISSWLR